MIATPNSSLDVDAPMQFDSSGARIGANLTIFMVHFMCFGMGRRRLSMMPAAFGEASTV
jgi:hypothetical protein